MPFLVNSSRSPRKQGCWQRTKLGPYSSGVGRKNSGECVCRGRAASVVYSGGWGVTLLSGGGVEKADTSTKVLERRTHGREQRDNYQSRDHPSMRSRKSLHLQEKVDSRRRKRDHLRRRWAASKTYRTRSLREGKKGVRRGNRIRTLLKAIREKPLKTGW